MVKKILVATDGSDHARRAIEYASDIAAKYDATVYLLHVISDNKIPDEVLQYIKVERIEQPPQAVYFKKIGEGIVGAAEKRARENGVKNVQSEVVQGDPADRIIEFAREKDVDMIIIGSRGLGSVKGLFLGSVSSKVCHAADCTCVTVK
ncbi:MAG: universal stress protein [Proteobacteria bacterium]|nr:universal stress protein [Pseudomonadota bacterium]